MQVGAWRPLLCNLELASYSSKLVSSSVNKAMIPAVQALVRIQREGICQRSSESSTASKLGGIFPEQSSHQPFPAADRPPPPQPPLP